MRQTKGESDRVLFHIGTEWRNTSLEEIDNRLKESMKGVSLRIKQEQRDYNSPPVSETV